MTKEESIAFAEKLQKNYANLDAAKEQIGKAEDFDDAVDKLKV